VQQTPDLLGVLSVLETSQRRSFDTGFCFTQACEGSAKAEHGWRVLRPLHRGVARRETSAPPGDRPRPNPPRLIGRLADHHLAEVFWFARRAQDLIQI
jgi:hypothetical protein